MKVFSRVVTLLDLFLAPELRTLESRDVTRARILAFFILVMIPCGFIPSLLLQDTNVGGVIWVHQGLINLAFSLVLLLALKRSRTHHRVAKLTVLWMHLLFVFVIVALPSLFSLAYLWSSCLIVFSSLIVGMRGAVFSASALTGLSILNIIYQYEKNTPWMTLPFDLYIEQILLGLIGSTLLTATATGIYEYMRDLNDRHQSRQRLIAARHAHTGSVGELVGHMAHEVNNPLAILQGSVLRLERQLEKNTWNHEGHKLLVHMLRSYERIIRVQQALSVFASGNQHEPFVSRDVRSIFRDVQLAMKPQAQALQIELEFIDAASNWVVRCQQHQLVFVLCSLIQNSMDALRQHPAPQIIVKALDENGRLALSVCDNGPGIDLQVQDRIFQPFFSTKTGGHGQGLSLSVSRGILARHAGEIHFTSHPGRTIFTCRLPREGAGASQLAKGA